MQWYFFILRVPYFVTIKIKSKKGITMGKKLIVKQVVCVPLYCQGSINTKAVALIGQYVLPCYKKAKQANLHNTVAAVSCKTLKVICIYTP
jgi:hypothetical protein